MKPVTRIRHHVKKPDRITRARIWRNSSLHVHERFPRRVHCVDAGISDRESRTTADKEWEIQTHKTALQLARDGHRDEALVLLHRGLKRNPRNSFFSTAAAVIEAKKGNLEAARNLYRTALESNHRCISALQSWAMTEKKAGNFNDASQLLNAALEMNPNHVISLQNLAIIEMKRKRFGKARSLLSRALEQAPTHVPALHVMADLELNTQNEPAAEAVLNKILELEPSNLYALTTFGEIQWKNGDYRKARQTLNRIQGNPSYEVKAQGLSFLAGLEAKNDNRKKARRRLIEALNWDSTHVSSLTSLAALDARSGKMQRAESIYQRAMELDPKNAHLNNAFAQFLRQLGKIEEARSVLLKFVQEPAANSLTWYILGELALQEGSLKDAHEYFATGINYQDYSEGVLLCLEGLAQLELFLGNVEKARGIYASGVDPYTPTSRFYRMWANLERSQGNNEAARELYQKSHEANPQDARTLLKWGMHEKKLKNYDLAEECFCKGLAVFKRNPYIWYSYGTMLVESGEVEKTREVFQRAVKYCPKNGPLLMVYAMFEQQHGNHDIARSLFEQGSSASDKQVHLPLLEAWASMEAKLENQEAVRTITARCNKILARVDSDVK